MKHVLLSILVGMLLAGLFLGCGEEEETSPEYYVRFKLGGDELTWSAGLDELGGGNSFGAVFSDHIVVFAARNSWSTNLTSSGEDFLQIKVEDTTAGNYGGIDCDLYLQYGGNNFDQDGLSTTVNSIGPIGGVMEGSFSATSLTYSGSGESYSLTEGRFRVLRIATNNIPY